MELKLESNPLTYLKCVAQMTKCQEETSENIVPDNYPDMQSIICAYADAIVRGKDCRNGSVIISGGIKGAILYHPEDQSYPRSLDFYFPFTCKLEDDQLTESSNVICTAKVRIADGRMINSRKALLRVDLECQIYAFEELEELLHDFNEVPATLQLKEETYMMNLPLEVSEKSFVISDSLDISPNSPPVVKVYTVANRIEILDQKIVGNKAVFKGNVVCKVLYLSDDENLYSHLQSFPFSQYCEFRNDYDDNDVSIFPAITGYDLETHPEENVRKGTLTVNLLIQAMVSGKKNIHLYMDAYSTVDELQPLWQEYLFKCFADCKAEKQGVRHQVKEEWAEIIDIDVRVSHPNAQIMDGIAQISVPISINVLGRKENGDIISVSDKTSIIREYPASCDVKTHSEASLEGMITSTLMAGCVELQFDVLIETSFICIHHVRTLCGGSIEPTQQTDRRPSLIIHRAMKYTELWELAKAYRSKKEAIRLANALDGDVLTEERMLLIPLG